MKGSKPTGQQKSNFNSKVNTGKADKNSEKLRNILEFHPLEFLQYNVSSKNNHTKKLNQFITDCNLEKFTDKYIEFLQARYLESGEQSSTGTSEKNKSNNFLPDGLLFAALKELDNQIQSDNQNDLYKVKNLCSIIRLILLHPNLNLNAVNNNKDTALAKLFNIWKKSLNEDVKQIIGDLLADYISITPNLGSIAQPHVYSRYYMIYSAFAASFVGWHLTKSHNFWKHMLVVPVLQSIYLTFSTLVAWYAVSHITNIILQSFFEPKVINLEHYRLTGSFADELLNLDSNQGLYSRIREVSIINKKQTDYKSLYLQRRQLLRKYEALVKLSNFKNPIKSLQLKFLIHRVEQAYNTVEFNQIDEFKGKIIFSKDLEAALSSIADKTFNIKNFSSILSEVKKDDQVKEEVSKRKKKTIKHKRNKSYKQKKSNKVAISNLKKEIVALYDLADKGYIKLSIEAMYILKELTNQFIFSEYKSPLCNKTYDERDNDQQVTDTDTFLGAFTTAINIKDSKDINKLEALKNFNKFSASLMKINLAKRKSISKIAHKAKNTWKDLIKEDQDKNVEIIVNTSEKINNNFLSFSSITKTLKQEYDNITNSLKDKQENLIWLGKITLTLPLACFTHSAIKSPSLRLPYFILLSTICFYPEFCHIKQFIYNSSSIAKDYIRNCTNFIRKPSSNDNIVN